MSHIRKPKRPRKFLKGEREENLAAADSFGWTQHDPYHWPRWINGQQLSWSLSTHRFRYMGKTYDGDPIEFIKRNIG